MSNKKKGFMNLIAGILSQTVILLLGILVPRLFLVNFGSETNGFLNSLTQIFSYFALFEAGVGTASLQALYRPVAQDDKKKISEILSATDHFYKKTGKIYILAVLVLAVVYPAVVVSDISNLTMSIVIIFNGLGGAISYLVQGKYILLLRAQGNNYIQSTVTIIVNILTNISKIILISLGCNLIIIQGSYFLINILQMLIYCGYINKKLRWVNLKVKPDYDAISQKKSVIIHQFGSLIFNSTDVVVLTFFLRDLKVVSVYAIYNMVISMCKSIVDKILESVTFRMGQLYSTDKKRYFTLHNYYEVGNMILVFSVFTVVYILIEPFIILYTDGVSDINYLAPGLSCLFVVIQFLSNARQPSSYLITYAGHFKETQRSALIETFINLIVSIIMVKVCGIYGVLIGTIVALIYRANDMILYTYRYIIGQKPWITYKRWLRNIVVFVFIAKILDKVKLGISSYGIFAMKGFFISVVVLMIYLCVNFIFEYEMFIKLIKSFFFKIKNR